MKLSVLIPTLNEEKYIGLLLDSLVNQTYKDFEVIIVDGKSENRTREIAESYKEKIDIRFVLYSKRSPSHQRNKAAKLSRSDHLVFFDADVKADPSFLEKLNHQIKTDTFHMAASWNIPLSNKLVDKFIFWGFNRLYLELLKDLSPGGVGTFIYVIKYAFLKVGGFNEEIIYAEDFDLIRRLRKSGYRYKLLKDPKIFFSVRRLEKEGRLNFVKKIVKSGIYYHLNNSLDNFKNLEVVQEKFGKHEFGKHL